MMTPPKLEDRTEQSYLGIRTPAGMREMSKVIPKVLGELFAWLDTNGVAPAGPPILRFHVIDMAKKMDIELGVPVSGNVSGDDRVKPGVLPAGRYATTVYTGVKNAVKANAALIDWAQKQGLQWDRWDEETGDAFRSRYETFLTGPEDNPDNKTWETEVAIKIADPK